MRMTEIDPHLPLPDDGLERSLMAAAADWQSRAPMEPNCPAPPPPPTSTVVQSIPPPRSDDVQTPVRNTVATTSTPKSSSCLLALDNKLSYADIAAGRRSPSVSRQSTLDVEAPPVAAADSVVQTAVQDVVVVEPVREVEEDEVKADTVVAQYSDPGRLLQKDKLVRSDSAAKHPSRSEQRRRAARYPPRRQNTAESSGHDNRERHPSVTPAVSVDVPDETTTTTTEPDTNKMEQDAATAAVAPETKPQEEPQRPTTSLSPPSDNVKRSRSPLWTPGTGPSYADILRGHYIPHHHRGLVGIVDTPQQQEQGNHQLQVLQQIGGPSIDETSATEDAAAVEEIVPQQQFAPVETAEERVNPTISEQVPAAVSDHGWMANHSAFIEQMQPVIAQQQQPVEYSPSVFQPGNLAFDAHYPSAPEPEAVFATPNFDLVALQRAYAHLEFNMPVGYPMPIYPMQEPNVGNQNFDFVEPRQQEFRAPSPPRVEPTSVAPQPIIEPVPTILVVPEIPAKTTAPEAQPPPAPVNVEKPPTPSTPKLSYAQILAAGLQQPSDSERRDSSTSASGYSISTSPRPVPKLKPSDVEDKSPVIVTMTPPAPAVPERCGSEPREPRSRQRLNKNSKSKSFDVREKDPVVAPRPKPSHGPSFKPFAMPDRAPAETKNRLKKKPSRNISEEVIAETELAAPVTVRVSPPEVKLAAPEPSVAVRSKSPGSGVPASEPEMTKAMMTFYGISSEDIEQLISSRSHDSDSEPEAVGNESSADAKKKQQQHQVQKKMKKKKLSSSSSSKVAEEDEIEKALREISELEKSKRSRMKRTHSHELKSAIPEQKPTAETVATVKLEVPAEEDQAKSRLKQKKLKKAASVCGGHPTKSSQKTDSSLTAMEGSTAGYSSSGSSDPSSAEQRRDKMKRAKTVSFGQETIVHAEPIVIAESLSRNEFDIRDITKVAEVPAPDNDNEFLVLDTQGMETVGHLMTDVESLMEDAMSDDVIVLETNSLAPVCAAFDGQRALDSQILEDVFTETAPALELPVCPEMFQEAAAEEEGEECLELGQLPSEETAIAAPSLERTKTEDSSEGDQKSSALLGPILIAEENKSEKIPSETTGELPLGSQPAAAMTLLPSEVRVTLRKISATNTVPFLPDEIQMLLEDVPPKRQPYKASLSVDLDAAPLEIASTLVFDQAETVGELDETPQSSNAEVSAPESFTCISAITHMAPVELVVAEQLPMLARQLSLAEEEFADESELSLPLCSTPIPAMLECEEESLTSATTEEPPTTTVYSPAQEQELPTKEQMGNIVEALLEEPKVSKIEAALPVQSPPETTPELVPVSVAQSSEPATQSIPLLTLGRAEAPVEVTSTSSPGSDHRNAFGFDDADHVVLSPQWMRQRPQLGRTFSLDPRNLPTATRSSTSPLPLVKSHSADVPDSIEVEQQKAAAAAASVAAAVAKSLDEGSKSESQTGGEADDEDVEVYWRLREKKKKKKRRAPVTTGLSSSSAGPRLSESSSDAFSMAELPTSPISVASDLPVSESTLTSDDEHRTKCTQDDGFQSGVSTPILMCVTSPDSEVPDTLTELTIDGEFSSLMSADATDSPGTPIVDIVQAADLLSQEEIPQLAELCPQIDQEVMPELEQQIVEEATEPSEPCVYPEYENVLPELAPVPKFEELIDDEVAVVEQVAPEKESPVIETLPSDEIISKEVSEVPTIISDSSSITQTTSWATLVATGKCKVKEPSPELEPPPRPPRPLPTLIVVGEEEHHETPCDPEGFHIGRKERKWRKWRSSQSESQDVASDAEPTEAVTDAPPLSSPQIEEPIKKVPPPSPADDDSESGEEMSEPVRAQLRSKVQKMAKSVRELEQRKRRSRLSESEQEILELAEAINENREIPCIRSSQDEHLKNLYLDNWPKPAKTTTDVSEKLFWIAKQSIDEDETCPVETQQAEPKPFNESEPLKVAEVAKSEETIAVEYPLETLNSDACDVPVVVEDFTSEAKEEEEHPKEVLQQEEPIHPSSLSWATVVATGKPVVAEKEDNVEEPVRPKRPLPTLIVVGEAEELPKMESDPDSFVEFIGRHERRRRKWRSSQSESQDYTTDEEHVEPAKSTVGVKSEVVEAPVEAPVDAPVECPAPAPVQVIEKDSDDEEIHEIHAVPHKERKAVTTKAKIPVKETEQRRRRSRLSESEKEALELAEVIEHGEAAPQLYYDLFADSWPHPFYVFLRNAEARWKQQEELANQRSDQTSLENQQATQSLREESTDRQIEQSNKIDLVEECVPESVQCNEESAPSSVIEAEDQHIVCPEIEQSVPVEGPGIPELPEVTECRQECESVIVKPLSWAAMVALTKAPPAPAPAPEPPEQVPLRPSKMPVLVVVSDEVVHPDPVYSDDPDGFHECVSKRERRRRKWRSSQSESQDADVSFDAEVPSTEPLSAPTPVSEPPQTSAETSCLAEVSQQSELRERSGSKSQKHAVAKVEKQTKDVERKRHKRQSESEREALQLAEAIESGQNVSKESAHQLDNYWQDKLVYSDVEKSWQESLSGANKVTSDNETTSRRRDSRSPDSGPPPKGPQGPQPPSANDDSSSSNSSSKLPTTQNVNADLPECSATWSDESTYLAIEPQRPDEEQQLQDTLNKVGIHPVGSPPSCYFYKALHICYFLLPKIKKKTKHARLAIKPEQISLPDCYIYIYIFLIYRFFSCTVP